MASFGDDQAARPSASKAFWSDDEDDGGSDEDHEDREAEVLLKAKEKNRLHKWLGKKRVRGERGSGENKSSTSAGRSGTGRRRPCLIHHSPSASPSASPIKKAKCPTSRPETEHESEVGDAALAEKLASVLLKPSQSTLEDKVSALSGVVSSHPLELFSLLLRSAKAHTGRKRPRDEGDDAGGRGEVEAGGGARKDEEPSAAAATAEEEEEEDLPSAERPRRAKVADLPCNAKAVRKFLSVLEEELRPPAGLQVAAEAGGRQQRREAEAASSGCSDDSGQGFYFTRKSKKAVYALASLAKQEETVEHIVELGGVSTLISVVRRCVNTKNVSVSRLHNPRGPQGSHEQGQACALAKSGIHKTAEYILKNTCLVMGFVSMNGQYRKQVIELGGVGALVNVLRCYSALCVQGHKGGGGVSETIQEQFRQENVLGCAAPLGRGERERERSQPDSPTHTIARRAAGALANLAHEDVRTKNLVREEGGVPALVLLLKAREFSVQVAAASTLKAIAFRNEDNKNQIVECGALGSLVCMLRSSDPNIHYEAVAVMSSLVHSSAHIKKLVLNCGALQPLINLLSSVDMESRREAALLLGQFANVQDPDYKSKIVQRGALGPLISMLSEEIVQVSEMAAFAIGRLAQNPDNQAGIVQAGGLRPLLQLLGSSYVNSQHNAAFALYGLSDNDDNVPHFLKSGCVSLLLNAKFTIQASKDCVRNTLRKLEEKIAQGHVLSHLKYLLSSEAADLTTKYYVATGLASLAPQSELHNIFMENKGLDVLFLYALNSECERCQKESIDAICSLGRRSKAFSRLPTLENGVRPGHHKASGGKFLGENYLNSDKFSDVTFLVEGRRVRAHRIALLAASQRAVEILGVERDEVKVEGVSHATWQEVLRFIYTGSCVVTEESDAQELLLQAERLQLEGLKHACETYLISTIDAQTVGSVYDLASRCNTTHLHKAAVWYTLSEHSRLVKVLGRKTVTEMLSKMFPTFVDSLTFSK